MDWSTLREVVDNEFRSRELAKDFACLLSDQPSILDVAGGTGANLRFLQQHLPRCLSWTNFDIDTHALKRFGEQHRSCSEQSFVTTAVDLSELDQPPLSQILSTGGSTSAADHFDGLACSAFVDLVSEAWLSDFLTPLAGQLPILLTMTRSGEMSFTPTHDSDETINRILVAHQESDHGFGPALGNRAGATIARILSECNCKFTTRETPWLLSQRRAPQMLTTMMNGIERRLTERNQAHNHRAWFDQRRHELRAGKLQITIPHVDILSQPLGKHHSH